MERSDTGLARLNGVHPRHALPPLDEALADADPPLGRHRFTTVHVIAACAMLLVAALVAGWLAWDSRVEPVAVEVPSPTASPSASSASPSPALFVHVLGAVATPGVLELPAGSIVQDAITAAGGFTADADPADLNLAAPLSSGQQIIVGTADGPQGDVRGDTVAGEPGDGGLVNLNTATAEELETLPGVGPVLAQSIVTWRDDNGGFSAVEELQEISGIGPRVFEKLEPLVTV